MEAPQDPTGQPAALDVPSLLDAYRNARRRLLLIDYDGTLVGYRHHPDEAVPPPEVLAILRSLAAQERNAVLLVSGRKRVDLEQWFGSLQPLWMAAEHGALLRRGCSSHWEPLQPDIPRTALDRVRPILQPFVKRAPGSFIEEKEFTLVWHYRKLEAALGDSLARELLEKLECSLAGSELCAIPGGKIVEIRPAWVDKGAVARRFLELCGAADFRLGIGDDRTDEDMFEALDPASWTVHVGDGASRARFVLAGPAEVLAVLHRMV